MSISDSLAAVAAGTLRPQGGNDVQYLIAILVAGALIALYLFFNFKLKMAKESKLKNMEEDCEYEGEERRVKTVEANVEANIERFKKVEGQIESLSAQLTKLANLVEKIEASGELRETATRLEMRTSFNQLFERMDSAIIAMNKRIDDHIAASERK